MESWERVNKNSISEKGRMKPTTLHANLNTNKINFKKAKEYLLIT